MAKKQQIKPCKLKPSKARSCRTICVQRWCSLPIHTCQDAANAVIMVLCGNATLPMRFAGPSNLTPEMYGKASQTAHTVLGIALACICCVWGALVVLPERFGKKQCYAAAGALSAAAGLYLIAWVQLLSTPDFARRDLVQRQHTAIGRCLLAAGLQELLFARARQGERLSKTHDAWFANLAVVALVFVGHPQRASRAVVAHVAIGCCLLSGAYLLASEKKADFRQSSLDAVYAGAAVALAAVVLVAYREPMEGGAVHRGVEATCMPGAYLAYLANAVAFATAAWLLVSYVLDARGRRAPRYELASTTEGGCPPAPDAVPKRYEPSPRAGGAPPAPDADDGTGALADEPPTPPPSPPTTREVRLVAITSGGPRKHALLAAFERRPTVWDASISRKAFGEATLNSVPGFILEFVEAVPGEACRTRKRTEQHCGDVLDDLRLDDAQREEFGRCAGLARPANRRVLGCLLANLRAMRVVQERRNALIVEDNVRPLLEGASRSVLKVLDDACDLLYLGHLAHADTLQRIPRGLSDAPQLTTDGQNHELWGTYAYRPSSLLYQAILKYIRDGFPKSLFHCRRRDCDVVPVDKLMQRVARKNGLSIKCLAPPVMYRMPPVLPSKIHRKWDAGYEEASRGQLALYGLAWRDVWLTPAEREIVSVEEHFINDVLADNAVFDAETRAKPFVPADQAAALLEIFDDDAVCAVVRAKLGSRFEACAATVEAWRSREDLGAAIGKVVEDLAADHLRPAGMLERLRGGVDAASYGVATLLSNMES